MLSRKLELPHAFSGQARPRVDIAYNSYEVHQHPGSRAEERPSIQPNYHTIDDTGRAALATGLVTQRGEETGNMGTCLPAQVSLCSLQPESKPPLSTAAAE